MKFVHGCERFARVASGHIFRRKGRCFEVMTVMMRKRFVAVIVALAVFGCCSSISVQAQAIESCTQYAVLSKMGCFYNWGPFEFSTMVPNAVCCPTATIGLGESCLAAKSSCPPPPDAASETCVACNEAAKAGTPNVSRPIDLATGNTFIIETDISVPGLGGGLSLTRTWNSLLPRAQNSYPFMFGSRWRSTYEERLVLQSPDFFLKYLRSDGSVWSYGVASIG